MFKNRANFRGPPTQPYSKPDLSLSLISGHTPFLRLDRCAEKTHGVRSVRALESSDVGSGPTCAHKLLCDPGSVSFPLWASVLLLVK